MGHITSTDPFHKAPLPPLLLFGIKRASLEALTKTIFIDSRETCFGMMHCLYIGQQPCPSGNKHQMKRHALPINVCLRFFFSLLFFEDVHSKDQLKGHFSAFYACVEYVPYFNGLWFQHNERKSWGGGDVLILWGINLKNVVKIFKCLFICGDTAKR